MLPALSTYNQSIYYMPVVPSPLSSSPLRNSASPLSPQDVNIPSSPPDRNYQICSPSKSSRFYDTSIEKEIDMVALTSGTRSMRQNITVTPPHTNRRESVYSKRTTKSNPLLNNRNSGSEGRETRRKLFLKRVRDVADDKRWKERGIGTNPEEEEILRCIWMQEERKREDRRRREASGIAEPAFEDVEEEIDADEVMAGEVAMSEEAELEQYWEMISESTQSNTSKLSHPDVHTLPDLRSRYTSTSQERSETLYGSDDDEYDEIFMDVIEEEQRLSSQQREPTRAYTEDEEMMDMS